MAERRMFNKTLMSSNQFTALNKSTQLLYMYLNLQADDDGICVNTQVICRMCGCGKAHLQALIDSGWLLAFEGGEVAITHWHIHNQIRKDRYKPSIYIHLKERLQKGTDGAYQIVEPGCQNCAIAATQDRIDQDRKEKLSIDEHRQGEDRKENTPAEPAVSSAAPPVAADDIHIDIDYDRILYYYQVMCKNLVPCEALTPKLRKLIADRVQDGYTQLRLCGVFQTAMMSEYLAGKNDRGWQASLEWLLDPMHIRDVESGKYTTWL